MNVVVDRETKIPGFGRTPDEAFASMQFNLERSGRLSDHHIQKRKEMHAWLPKPNLLHVTGVGAIVYEKGFLRNLVTGRKVKLLMKPFAHYLCVFSAFDGLISFEDFTLVIAPEVNRFLSNISDKYLTINDFPYINPADSFKPVAYHQTVLESVSVVETDTDTIILMLGDGKGWEVNRSVGVDSDCLLAYLFASQGFTYDGESLERITDENRSSV